MAIWTTERPRERVAHREKPLELSIIIINWNTRQLLYNCLQSIDKGISGFSYEVIVVDNASTDGSREMIRAKFPTVILIENARNLGFARANNQAFKRMGSNKYVLLLNSDVIVSNDCVQKLKHFLDNNPSVGAVGPALRMPDGSLQRGGVGGYFPSLKTGLNYFFLLSTLFPRNFKGIYINQAFFKQYKEYIEIDWIAGTCLMTRKEVIEEIGDMDESIFLYTEDIEWCERIRRSGRKMVYFPKTEVIHHLYGSQKEITAKGFQALVKYVQYKKGVKISIVFRLITFIGLMIRFIGYFVLSLVSGDENYKEKYRRMYVYTSNLWK